LAPTDQPRRFNIQLPGGEPSPLRRIGLRVAIALALILLVAILTWLGRGGYVDPEDSSVSLLDAFYYSTVSITTTGYGDIRPVTDEARLVTTILVTPARVLFLVLLVGTTLEILAERSRAAFRIARWRRKLMDHVIVCGYGTKGRSAVRTLQSQGVDSSQFVVIDQREEPRNRATADGLATLAGDATLQDVLQEAGIATARAVVVAVDRDDTAVLVTLTAREQSPDLRISVAVREEENAHLLHTSGADTVITSSAASGRLLGLATESPRLVQLIEDLLIVGEGLDIVERRVEAEEAGPLDAIEDKGLVIGIVRGDELIRFDDPRMRQVRPGDCIVELRSVDDETQS
jgi:voltage-gated potassium channel